MLGEKVEEVAVAVAVAVEEMPMTTRLLASVLQAMYVA
jgi:hypothetical protein